MTGPHDAEPLDPRADNGPDRDLEWRLHAMLEARADAVRADLDGPRLRAAAAPRSRRGARVAPALATAAAVAAVAVGVAVFTGHGADRHAPPVQPGGVSGSRTAAPSQPVAPRTTAAVPSPSTPTLAPGRGVKTPAPSTTPSGSPGAPRVSAPRSTRAVRSVSTAPTASPTSRPRR